MQNTVHLIILYCCPYTAQLIQEETHRVMRPNNTLIQGVRSGLSLPPRFGAGLGPSLPQFSPLAVLGSGRRQRWKRRSRSPARREAIPKDSTFQKKINVFEYNPRGERRFARTNSNIVISGLLPELSLSASEDEVSAEIVAFIQNSSSNEYNVSSDFEFIQVSGKVGQVAQARKGFEWSAVRNLAGQGSIYIRLTHDFKVLPSISDSDSDFDLPGISQKPINLFIGPTSLGVAAAGLPSFCS